MAFIIKEKAKTAIVKEVTEGTYEAPASGTDFIESLEDGVTIEKPIQLKERNNTTGSRGRDDFRLSVRDGSVTVPVECTAGDSEGAEPRWGKFAEGFLGGKRSGASQISDSAGENTVNEIYLADTSIYKVGDIIMAKEAGAYHISSIVAVDGDKITLLLSADSAFADDVEVSAFNTYLSDDDAPESAFSVSKWHNDEVLEKVIGCKVSSCNIENWNTGEIPTVSTNLKALNWLDEELNSLAIDPVYKTAVPPLILGSCSYIDGVKATLSELSVNMEQTVSDIKSNCAENGKVKQRFVDKRNISLNINPYKEDDDLSIFDKYKDAESFSFLTYAFNPTAVDGEKKEVVAIYMPKCKIETLTKADVDGVIVESLVIRALEDKENGLSEIYIGTI